MIITTEMFIRTRYLEGLVALFSYISKILLDLISGDMD